MTLELQRSVQGSLCCCAFSFKVKKEEAEGLAENDGASFFSRFAVQKSCIAFPNIHVCDATDAQ